MGDCLMKVTNRNLLASLTKRDTRSDPSKQYAILLNSTARELKEAVNNLFRILANLVWKLGKTGICHFFFSNSKSIEGTH